MLYFLGRVSTCVYKGRGSIRSAVHTLDRDQALHACIFSRAVGPYMPNNDPALRLAGGACVLSGLDPSGCLGMWEAA
jgi:hypothetical protein